MSIYKKLLDFQKEGISIKKNSVGGHHKNLYADIDEVLEKVKPALSKVGIVLTQIPTETGLKTILADYEDDTFIEGFLPFIGATDAQKIGSNLTYMRRYSIVSMLGLEADDDDGHEASAKPAPAKAVIKPAAPVMTIELACKSLRGAENLDELKEKFKALPTSLQKDNEVVALKDELKEILTAI